MRFQKLMHLLARLIIVITRYTRRKCDLTEESGPPNRVYGIVRITPVCITLSGLAFGSRRSENPAALCNSGRVPFLCIGFLFLPFRSSLRSSFVGGRVTRVMGLSLGYSLAKVLQVTVRVLGRSALDVKRSIWLKVEVAEWLACTSRTK